MAPLPAVPSLPPEPPTDPESGRVFGVAPDSGGVAGASARSAPRGELVVRSGPAAGLRFALHEGVITVGRSSQSDCPLHDEAVSRRHFELEMTPDAILLRDLGSGNGTRVNGRRVEEARLQHGDRIVAGNSTLEFLETPGENQADPDPVPGERGPGRRRWLGLAVGVPGLAIAALVSTAVLHHRHTQRRLAEQAFARGLAELAEDPPDPNLALADLSAAQRDIPDQRALRDAIAEARDVAGAIQRLAGARALLDEKSFADARGQLQGLPAGPYFDRMTRAISEEITQREAAQLSAPHTPMPVIRALAKPRSLAQPLATRGPIVAAKKPHRTLVAPPDDDRAEQLCDDADALLGPNPEAARRKYREALKAARPGSAAARRAQGGLAN